MHAIDIILEDHAKIRALFTKVKNSQSDSSVQTHFQALGELLLRHEKMEETLFYPHFQHEPAFKPLVTTLIGEENKASNALKKLNSMKSKEEFKQGFMELNNDVEAHATHEEMALFPKVKQFLSLNQLKEIGKDMQEYRSKAKSEMKKRRRR